MIIGGFSYYLVSPILEVTHSLLDSFKLHCKTDDIFFSIFQPMRDAWTDGPMPGGSRDRAST